MNKQEELEQILDKQERLDAVLDELEKAIQDFVKNVMREIDVEYEHE